MREAAVEPPTARRSRLRDAAGYILVAGAVWLGWEAIRTPIAARTPPEMALRLAPTSPEVLRRAAEAELLAGRLDNARALSDESLARGPFSARALRVRGLVEAQAGSPARADEMLTLAGNWSLRDDPAHAWLLEYRLRRGDYASAFAHADTLVRRRTDLYPSIFGLFTAAAAHDPRAMQVIANLLATNPPWRAAFLDFLYRSDQGAPVVATLAVALQRTEGPFTPVELEQLYNSWLSARRFPGLRQLRSYLGPLPTRQIVQNGDFELDLAQQIQPFGWRLGTGSGMTSSIIEDDLNDRNMAYRLDYDGFRPGVFLEQLLLLEPGAHTMTGDVRAVTPGDVRMGWRLQCAETGLDARRAGAAAPQQEWTRFQVTFVVPEENCSAQWLRLTAEPGDRRVDVAVWFDDIAFQNSRAPSRRTTALEQ